APQPQLQRTEIGDVAIKRGFRRNALGLALGADRPVVEPVREPKQPRALGAVAASQLALAGALQIADGAQAVARQALLRDFSDAEDQRDRSWRQEGGSLAATEHRKPARFVEIGGDLGQELVGGEPDRHTDAERTFDL